MIELGRYNILRADRRSDFGMYLCDNEENEVLLPNKYVDKDLEEGDEIKVFVYNDSEDRLVATTLTPKAQCHEFAYLKVKDVNRYGAFLDWGLEKDLMVPFREQKKRMEEGRWYIVFLFVDEETDRLVATAKVERFFEKENLTVKEGDKVGLMVYSETDLGINVVVNNLHTGLIYKNEIFRILGKGEQLEGYVKKLRKDGKLDIALQPQGHISIEPNAQKIVEELKANGGFLPLTDKSPAEEITSMLEMSKKTFKKALGSLYKQRQVRLEKEGIYWLGNGE